MNKKAIELLEYDKIKKIIKNFALSDLAKEEIDKLEPYINISLIEKYMKETTEARAIVDINSSIPIHSLVGMNNIKQKIKKGIVLNPEDLDNIAGLLREIAKLKRFMSDKEYVAPTISSYALSTFELDDLVQEIQRCIIHGGVDDRASSELLRIRKKIAILEERIRSKLESILRNEKYKSYIQDGLISTRNGRYVIPVKNQYRKNIEGSIHDMSGSGSTAFIEPAEVKKYQDELNIYIIEEEKEVYRILSTLTAMIGSRERELNINIETMCYYDLIFAKGKYSKSIDGKAVKFNADNYINIRKGKHPLIGMSAVPLDFVIGKEYKGVIITGPNTGGKTVALKTVGLLTMMAQSGIHVPVEDESEFAVFTDALVDIGDGQSIEQSLSTFSSHIKNIISILDTADRHTLVIIDEIGAGTDPGEGMGIAIAVLEELYRKKATILATTHYSEIKDFALNHEGFVNGCMEFDINTLKPLYKLNIGKPGESNAFLIALRLGMNKKIIERAHEVTYKEQKEYLEYKSEDREENLENKKETSANEQKLQKIEEAKLLNKAFKNQKTEPEFNIGDCVYISFMSKTGIIYELENAKGEYGVIVMKKKLKINKKRLSFHIDKDELYPENYDFDIVFESKEDRKKKSIMNKKHVKGMEIELKE